MINPKMAKINGAVYGGKIEFINSLGS